MPEYLQNRLSNLTPMQREMVILFADFVNSFGLPNSIGEIFGYLFANPQPVEFESVVTDLGISRGSASQGLRFLQSIDAIRVHRIPGHRRTQYTPETSLRNLLSGILSNTLEPRLRQSADQIDLLEALASDPMATHPVIHDRVHRLRRWNSRANRLLPFLARFAGSAGRGSSDERRGSITSLPD